MEGKENQGSIPISLSLLDGHQPTGFENQGRVGEERAWKAHLRRDIHWK
jgi:hypothetical protein